MSISAIYVTWERQEMNAIIFVFSKKQKLFS
jgi:hypothetical protein